MKKYTLVTGSGSGLGREFAIIYAKRDENLILVDVNNENLNSAKKEIAEINPKIDVITLCYDLTNRTNLKAVYQYTLDHDFFIDRLINAAGFGDRCDFKDMDIDKQLKMNDLNVDAVLYFTRVFLTKMLENKEGNILNISSIAAFMPGTYMCTYHASKAYVLNFGEAVAEELKGTGVTLTTLCPGPFTSNFVKVAGNDYTFEKIKPISAREVALIGAAALDKKKRIHIIGWKNRLMIFAIRFAPRSFVAKLAGQTMKAKEK